MSSDSTYTRDDFERDFSTDAACLEWLKDFRWPDGITCPKCERVTGHSRGTKGPYYACNQCGWHTHPTAGTIYHKSSVSLVLWFEAVFLVASTRCGISAKQLEREIGVTYKTAHRMMKLIRSQMGDDDQMMLGGEVESDETYFNRSRRLSNRTGKPGRSPGAKVVWGAVERHGRVVVRHVPNATVSRGHGRPHRRVRSRRWRRTAAGHPRDRGDKLPRWSAGAAARPRPRPCGCQGGATCRAEWRGAAPGGAVLRGAGRLRGCAGGMGGHGAWPADPQSAPPRLCAHPNTVRERLKTAANLTGLAGWRAADHARLSAALIFWRLASDDEDDP